MPRERDVRAFDERARTYESGWRGRMHLDIATHAVDLALGLGLTPKRVLDVGCGTGLLLRHLADRLPEDCQELLGVDAAKGMIDVASSETHDPRLGFSVGVAEHLPYADEHFDLVFSTTSFDHWEDQAAGVAECFRVIVLGGHFVLTDLFSLLLLPTLAGGRRGRARTKGGATALLRSAGFNGVGWHRLYQGIIASAVAKK